jgi:hypothetical protein
LVVAVLSMSVEARLLLAPPSSDAGRDDADNADADADADNADASPLTNEPCCCFGGGCAGIRSGGDDTAGRVVAAAK